MELTMKFLLGLLVGFGLGVGLGLILAPQSGEATEAGEGLFGRASSLVALTRERATEALSQGREMYARTRAELRNR